jgi:hypothetical protein
MALGRPRKKWAAAITAHQHHHCRLSAGREENMPLAPIADYSALDRADVLSFLFHPRKTTGPGDSGERCQEILIPVESGIRIGVRLHMTHPDGPSILFFHGNGEIASDYDDMGPLFNRQGVNFMVADYRGYGSSDGSPTVTAMMADCQQIFDFIRLWTTENGFSGPLIVMGRSLGSASALELAEVYGNWLSGLVIESGFAWAGPLLRRLGVDPDRIGFDEAGGFANVDKISRFVKPTVIIHAEFDQLNPPRGKPRGIFTVRMKIDFQFAR